jgi:alpha-mannosidase
LAKGGKLNNGAAPPSDIARPRGRYAGYTRARLAAFARRLKRAIYPASASLELIEMAGPVGRIGFEEAAALDYHAVEVGQTLGPLWTTYWFRITASVPKDWAGARVDLDWDSASEAMLWLDGRSARGLNIGRENAPLVVKARGGESLTFHVEVACNRAFGADHGGGDGRGSRAEGYALAVCELRRFDADAWRLYHDFEILRQLEADRNPPQTSRAFGGVAAPAVRPALDTTWVGRLLHDLNRVCNVLDPDKRATWPAGHAILDALLGARNGEVTHKAFAVGHAHIDTAWLWPIEETRRKCQRTFATAVALIDEYPSFKFACSQAYQYAVIEEADPDLFARIRAKVQSGQWIPIGGSWVEPDCNLPSGESLSRQFLYGQRYFERTFGARSTVFWNPDVFGYCGQLPQLMREAGMTRFLTQKLSWNRFTSPPHHSFRWRGLDGSEVVTHFPPADTYNGVATVEELRYHGANYKDADRSAEAMYLFGHGDGGGGATPEMIERLARCADLQGVPRVETQGPDAFFETLETRIDDLAIIEGELYFEYHRGTYTSQAEIKRLNRRLEGALQSLDYLAAASGLAGRRAPTRERIEGLWRILLTNQFHDILPGSSIAEVYARANVELGDLARDVDRLSGELLAALGGVQGELRPMNTIGFDRAEVALDPDGAPRFIRAPAFAAGAIAEATERVRVTRGKSGEVRLENGRLTAILTAGGALKSLIHRATGRETLAGEGNRMVLFKDRPTAFEAWDIDPFALETARDAPAAHAHKVIAQGPLRAEVRFERQLGADSTMIQTVRLDAASEHLEFDTHLDWRERRV